MADVVMGLIVYDLSKSRFFDSNTFCFYNFFKDQGVFL